MRRQRNWQSEVKKVPGWEFPIEVYRDKTIQYAYKKQTDKHEYEKPNKQYYKQVERMKNKKVQNNDNDNAYIWSGQGR